MCGHHAGLVWLAVEQPKRGAVDLGVGLVALGKLRREHGVHPKIGELEQVHQQRHMAIGQRGGDELAAQAVEARAAVRPGPQPPPAPDEDFPVGGRHRDVPPGKHAGQRLAVQRIEIAPGRAVPHPVHRGLIRAPPVVDDAGPVGLQAAPGSGRRREFDETGAPVH